VDPEDWIETSNDEAPAAFGEEPLLTVLPWPGPGDSEA
jgi:hypothetical protein